MDWNAAIERHRDTLKRILAALVAMAGLADGRTTLPRHLHRAVMRLLRPAEAAARRLIIAQARGLAVALRARKEGTMALPRRAKPKPERSRQLGFPLLDPMQQPFLRRRPVQAGVPRISVPGFSAPFPVAPPLSPHDPVDAARLGRRLAALALALDDLPGQALRALAGAGGGRRARGSQGTRGCAKNPQWPAGSPAMAAAPRLSARQPAAAGS